MITRIALVVLIAAQATSCGVRPDVAPREPVPANVVHSASRAFDTLARAGWDAWTTPDGQTAQSPFAGDAVFHDESFGDHAVGIDEITSLLAFMSTYAPSWEATITERYIGLGDGIAVTRSRNISVNGHDFTQADPLLSVDRLQFRDGRITYWTAFYAFDSLQKTQGASRHLDEAKAMLSSYQAAWSSGDSNAVARLYAVDAEWKDTLFGQHLEGRREIESFAEKFFNWYPGGRWDLSLDFGNSRGDPLTTGGLFLITVPQIGAQDCQVGATVLLQISGAQIIRQSLYYQPESLVSCGWAR